MLFGWLPQTRPQGGTRMRWRDVVRCDLRAIAMSDANWYDAALSRTSWRETYSAGLHADEQQARPAPQEHVLCFKCKRSFRREGDKARHKCTAECQKPICEQRGAVQCTICLRWFRSKGGLAVHRCDITPHSSRPDKEASSRRRNRPSTQQQPSQPLRPVQCQQCER